MKSLQGKIVEGASTQVTSATQYTRDKKLNAKLCHAIPFTFYKYVEVRTFWFMCNESKKTIWNTFINRKTLA